MSSNVFTECWNGSTPPNYSAVFAWRVQQLQLMRANPKLWVFAKAYYRERPVEFIEHWLTTYDPRLAGTSRPSTMPFILFQRQKEFVRFLHQLILLQNNGLIEKSRDMGATWVCAAFSIWVWLFIPESSVGWGSRVEDLVDKLGDSDSILEKIRLMLRLLPREFWPKGFDIATHAPFMRIINPETMATITGDAGKNIGRGGRKLIYFVDEAAHLENPEAAEAALSETTRVRVDISSVNGPNNVFHNKRKAGALWTPTGFMDTTKTSVFIFDWRDHPEKTQAWYDKKRSDRENQGLLHLFAQEVERDYNSAVSGIIIKAQWVTAAFGAAEALGFDDEGAWCAGLDVADDTPGGDANALVIRKGPILKFAEPWGGMDTGATARRSVLAIKKLVNVPIVLQYDSIGVGAGVKAEMNRLATTGELPKSLGFAPWSAGATPLRPDQPLIRGDRSTPLNKDIFRNLKAQAWFEVARRFERTFKARQLHGKLLEAKQDPNGVWEVYDPGDLISIPADHPLRFQLEAELSQAVWKDSDKMIVDKTPKGARSPNLADALIMAYFPVKTGVSLYTAGSLG